MVKQIARPGWMHETSAQAWCTGKTQRDRVERKVGGGIGMGNTCKSMADSCQCMTKPVQYCKVISLQLIQINGKKIKSGKKKKKERCVWSKHSPAFRALLLESEKERNSIMECGVS